MLHVEKYLILVTDAKKWERKKENLMKYCLHVNVFTVIVFASIGKKEKA